MTAKELGVLSIKWATVYEIDILEYFLPENYPALLIIFYKLIIPQRVIAVSEWSKGFKCILLYFLCCMNNVPKYDYESNWERWSMIES